MPRKYDYPAAPFSKALELAEAIDSLGGTSTREIAAQKIGFTSATSGAAGKVFGATSKYNLITVEKDGRVSTSATYKAVKLSYTSEEKQQHLESAFFSPPIFKQLHEKLNGKKLPVEILPQMLIREYGVEKDNASRVAAYFSSGLKELNLLETDNTIKSTSTASNAATIQVDNNISNTDQQQPQHSQSQSQPITQPIRNNGIEEASIVLPDCFYVQFIGPGMNSKIEIKELDDLTIVEAFLTKIRKKINGAS